MEQKTNYGKIFAITLSVIAAASAIAFVLYRLLRNLIAFCTVYDDPDDTEDRLDFDETDELLQDADLDGEDTEDPAGQNEA